MLQATRLKDESLRCIQSCRDCERACEQALRYCLHQGQRYAEVASVQPLLDCIDLCRANLSILTRGLGPHRRVCATCAQACERSAQACAQLGEEPVLQACAQACRRCAEVCRRISEDAARDGRSGFPEQPRPLLA